MYLKMPGLFERSFHHVLRCKTKFLQENWKSFHLAKKPKNIPYHKEAQKHFMSQQSLKSFYLIKKPKDTPFCKETWKPSISQRSSKTFHFTTKPKDIPKKAEDFLSHKEAQRHSILQRSLKRFHLAKTHVIPSCIKKPEDHLSHK